MEVKEALSEIRIAMGSTHHGFRWYGSDEYRAITEMEPEMGLQVAEQALREMTRKSSLDDATYFALENQLSEKVLFYNLLLRARERQSSVALQPMDLALFRAKIGNCVLMDYGASVDEMTKIICHGEPKLPEGVDWKNFHF